MIDRRSALRYLAGTPLVASASGLVGCDPRAAVGGAGSAVLRMLPLPAGVAPWPTPDPFLFCVHHDDAYPRGNPVLGPAAALDGRDLGMDFAGLANGAGACEALVLAEHRARPRA